MVQLVHVHHSILWKLNLSILWKLKVHHSIFSIFLNQGFWNSNIPKCNFVHHSIQNPKGGAATEMKGLVSFSKGHYILNQIYFLLYFLYIFVYTFKADYLNLDIFVYAFYNWN